MIRLTTLDVAEIPSFAGEDKHRDSVVKKKRTEIGYNRCPGSGTG